MTQSMFAYGKTEKPSSTTCLDNLQNDDKDTNDLGSMPVHIHGLAQFSSLRKYELRREDNCAHSVSTLPSEDGEGGDVRVPRAGASRWSGPTPGREGDHKATKSV